MPGKVLKISMTGDAAGGKTNILSRFVSNKFSPAYKATIGADFATKQVELNTGESVALQIWDTAGQERFQSLGAAFLRGSDAIVLVCSCDNLESVAGLKKQVKALEDAGLDLKKIPVLVLLNKVDLPDAEKKVSKADVQSIMRHELDSNILYFDSEPVCVSASAADSQKTLSILFQGLAEMVLSGKEDNGDNLAEVPSLDDDDDKKTTKKKASSTRNHTGRNFFGFKS